MNNLDYYRIEKAITYLDKNLKKQPSLDDLSAELKLSPFHLQKMFKDWAGISPKKFLEFLSVEHIKQKLNQSESALNSAYDTGLSSSSRLYDLFVNVEAITPAEYKKMGKGLEIIYGFHETPFGLSLIGITDRGICGLYFVQSSRNSALAEMKTNWPNAKFTEDETKTKVFIDEIFGNKKSKIGVLLKGTNFQIQVWKALLSIPEGKLTTYEGIAKRINSKAIRAVGTAV